MIRRLIILLLIVGCEEVLEPEDCAGVAGGAAVLDECEICVGGTTGLTACTQDCADVWGGTAVLDDCGICDGIADYVAGSCYDCADTPNGDALVDNCGVCDSDATNDCPADCNGDWGGTSVLSGCDNICNSTATTDNCGVCDSDLTNDCVKDCADEWGGDSVLSGCDNACGSIAVEDCAGVCGGSSVIDECGECDGIDGYVAGTCYGCTHTNACNFNSDATILDDTCWFASEGCDCEDSPDSIIDCLGICDADANNNPPIDNDGNCCASLDENCAIIVIGGCIDSTMCNYDPNATYNDDSCAIDLSQFGGTVYGTDCNGECGGFAVKDECDLCVGGSTNLGQSWRIKINSIATFKLQDGTSIGVDTNSVTLGTSIYALDGYNGTEIGGGNPSCENCYIDLLEPPSTIFENDNNSIRFYFPHDDISEWDEWGSQFDFEIDPYFIRDIRSNDLHSLAANGIQWDSIIEPTLIETAIMDSLYLSFEYLENINNCTITVTIDDGFEYMVVEEEIRYAVNSSNNINLTFIISKICFAEY